MSHTDARYIFDPLIPPPGGRGVLGWAYLGHSTQHYRDQGTSGLGVTAAVLNYINRLLIQVSRQAGTLYLSLRNALASLFDLQ